MMFVMARPSGNNELFAVSCFEIVRITAFSRAGEVPEIR
jgi:hypothetical protein